MLVTICDRIDQPQVKVVAFCSAQRPDDIDQSRGSVQLLMGWSIMAVRMSLMRRVFGCVGRVLGAACRR
jgi:hypothetical protein